MSVKREPKMRQDTPRMQLITLVQSAWGNIHNQIPDGAMPVVPVDLEALKYAISELEKAQEILRQMPEGEWETEDPEKEYAKRVIKRMSDALVRGEYTVFVTKKPSKQLLSRIRAHWARSGFKVIFTAPVSGAKRYMLSLDP